MSFPRYPEYKDSGVEWLGEVPAHWFVKPVKTLASCNDDILEESTEADYEIEYVEISGVEAGRGITQSNAILFANAPSRARRRVHDGDVIVSTVRTYLRAIAPVTSPPANMIVSTGFAVIRPHSVVSGYLGYLFQTEFVIAEVIARSVGVSYPAINSSELMRLHVPVPDATEQADIAAFLDHETAKIDALVAEQEKLIALLKEKRQAVISHAVTKGLNPDAPMKDSGIEWLGEVPAHWDVAPMKYIVKLQSGGTPSKDRLDYWEGDIPWASAKDMKVDRLVETEDHITAHAIEEGAAVMVPAGSVVVVVRGMILARTFPVALTMCEITINQDLKAVFCCERLRSEFFAWYLRGTSDESLCRLDEAGHGTKALRMDAWTSMEVALPPLSEQQEIADFVEASCARFDALIDEVAKAMNLLKERRSALISAAVTGNIDVRGFAAEKEAA